MSDFIVGVVVTIVFMIGVAVLGTFVIDLGKDYPGWAVVLFDFIILVAFLAGAKRNES